MEYKTKRQLKIEIPCRIRVGSHPIGVLKLKNHCCQEGYVLLMAKAKYANSCDLVYYAACSCGLLQAREANTPNEAVMEWLANYDRLTEEEIRIRISELSEEYTEAVFDDSMLVEDEDPEVFESDEDEEMTLEEYHAMYGTGDD